MSRSNIQAFGAIAASGITQSAVLRTQRVSDDRCHVQIDIPNPGNITSGTLQIAGRPSEEAEWSGIVALNLGTNLDDSVIFLNIHLFPQMTYFAISAVSSPTVFLNGFLME